MNPEAIPQWLRDRPQWLLWDSSADSPRRPHWKGDFTVSWSDPSAWHTFEEAVEAAETRDSWGIGYVTARENDNYARGVVGVLDIDGGNREPFEEKLKPWVPSLEPFVDDGAYIEFSPSGTGLHIPFIGEVPDWWKDCQLGDHEGVDVRTNKFCTFTGSKVSVSGDTVTELDVTPWLMEAHASIRGEAPNVGGSEEAATDRSGDYSPDDEWLDDDLVEEALDHLDADAEYSRWRDIAFAVHDYDPGHAGKALFESWSRGGTKWDDNAERLTSAIWEGATQGSGITVGTLVHLAKEAGWQPFGGRGKPTFDVTADADDEETEETAHADGGATADASVAETPQPNTRQSEASLRASVESHVFEYQERDDVDKSTVIHRTALDILERYHFLYPAEDARGWRLVLYRYDPDRGVYSPDGERFVSELAERLLGDFLTNQQVRELVGRIQRLSGVDRDELETPPNRLVVANGIVDLHTGELDDWTPDEPHRTRVNIEYHPDAECPAIDDFLHEIVRPGDVSTLYQIAAHSLYREYLHEKAAMLVGDGQNGKSVFLSLLVEFLGDENVTHRSLQDLDGNQFAANSLEGKLANLHPDMGDETVRDLGTFKKLTGRDTMVADVKYEKPITFENHATLVFAANRMPAMQEDTHALWRRWVYVNFPYKFSDKDPDAKDPVPKRVLMRDLTADSELEGLLARCVEEISAWWEGRDLFDDVMPPSEVREKMKRASEPIYDFAMTCLEPSDEDDYLTKDAVRNCYQQYAREEDLPTQPDNVFGERLLAIRDLQMESCQRREEGRRVRAYSGVRFTDRGRQVLGLDDVDDDDQETIDGGTTGRMRDLVEAVRELETPENAPSKGMIVGRASASMNPRRAELAFDEAKASGEIMRDGDGWRTTD